MRNISFLKLKKYLLQYALFRRMRSAFDKHGQSPAFLTGKAGEAESVMVDWPEEIKRPFVGLVKDFTKEPIAPAYAYWPKYQRFLQANNIPFDYLDIHASDWMERAAEYDLIVWHVESDPASQHEAETKIFLIENHLKKWCYPSFHEIWFYEDKIRQDYLFRLAGIPSVPTMITHDYREAIKYAAKAELPLVSKISTGSGSLGVELVRNRSRAREIVRQVFFPGRKTYWTYLRQKDYIYFQKYIKDAGFDLRAIVIGNKVFGYYRMRPERDFRASGAGLYDKRELPEEAIRIALRTRDALKADMIAVDMIRSEKDGNYLVIEASIFIQIDTAEQLVVNGVPGYYEHDGKGGFFFKAGRFWIQELVLAQITERWRASQCIEGMHFKAKRGLPPN